MMEFILVKLQFFPYFSFLLLKKLTGLQSVGYNSTENKVF